MLYELQRFFCKLGLTSGPGVLPDGEQDGTDNDRNNDLTATTRHPSKGVPTPKGAADILSQHDVTVEKTSTP